MRVDDDDNSGARTAMRARRMKRMIPMTTSADLTTTTSLKTSLKTKDLVDRLLGSCLRIAIATTTLTMTMICKL